MLKGFRDFILRGSVIDLAVAVVIGAAFTALINQFTKSFIEPILNLFGDPTADKPWGIQLNDNPQTFINLSAMLSALITFLITAAVVYFVFVAPMNKYKAMRGITEEPEITEVEVLKEIRDELKAQRGA